MVTDSQTSAQDGASSVWSQFEKEEKEMMKFHTVFFFFSFLGNNILRKKSAISGGNWKQGRVENSQVADHA